MALWSFVLQTSGTDLQNNLPIPGGGGGGGGTKLPAKKKYQKFAIANKLAVTHSRTDDSNALRLLFKVFLVPSVSAC